MSDKIEIDTDRPDYTPVSDDVVLPFQVDALDVRGRAVQLGPMLDRIFERHAYPTAVSVLLGEIIVLTVLLGTSLKFEGKFIVQTQTDGPVSLLVVDFVSPDSVRAYARFDAERIEEAISAGHATPEELLGKGMMGMTIDQGSFTRRYQGIVALEGQSLEEVARQYFRQSEQIPTEVKLAVAEIYTPSDEGNGSVRRWRAGGVLIQFLPEAPDRMKMPDLHGGDGAEEEDDSFSEDEAWQEARSLVGTISADELTDPQISPERLLYRLFHESGVRVHPGKPVFDKCSCSREKVIGMIQGFSEEDREGSFVDGVAETVCEFCSSKYQLTREEIGQA
ncbi:MAG: Hsp33 family molecular chaperone [Rhizobiaceae bacterium]|nr:Hsp33 family molecular chaperone [Rhizobiaceae bacterium]